MPKILGERDGSASGEETATKSGKFWTIQGKYSRIYTVLADNASQDEATIATTTPGLPVLFAVLGKAKCTSRKLKEIATIGAHPVTGAVTILWEVECGFDSDVDTDEADEDPTDRTPKVRWYGENEEEVLERDAINGDPIQTAAGERIIVTGPVVIAILEIRRFETPPFDPDTQFDYANHVNSTTFWGAPEGTGLMQPIEASEAKVLAGQTVIEVTYRIKFKIRKTGSGMASNTWMAKPLHEGSKYFKTLGQPAEVYLDKHGNRTKINLAANGTQLGSGDDPVYLEFNRFPKANFNSLSLGPF